MQGSDLIDLDRGLVWQSEFVLVRHVCCEAH